MIYKFELWWFFKAERLCKCKRCFWNIRCINVWHKRRRFRRKRHLQKRACPKCGNSKKGQDKKLTKEEFIEKAKKIHGDKYDYSKVDYINNRTKVCIICPEHGEFYTRPEVHLAKNKHGCPMCFYKEQSIRQTKTTEEFIKEAKEIHGDKYDY